MQAPLYKSPYDIPVGTVLGMSFPQGPLNPMDFMGQEFGFDQQPLQQPMMGAMDQGYGGDMGNQSRYDENGFRRSDGRRKVRGFSNPAAHSTKMPFGGAFARGGIAPAGRVSIVGDGGGPGSRPEMIIPSGPTMVIPMTGPNAGRMPMSGPLSDRGPMGAQTGPLSARGPMGAQSGPLSMRGPTPTGRGMTPERRMKIAERQAASRGDAAGAADWASRASWAARYGNGGQPSMPMMPQQPMPMPMPMAPARPTGKLVPGRSAGSMVWQPEAPPIIDVPESPSPMQMSMPQRSAPALPAGDAMPMDMPQMPMSGPLDNDRNILGPLQLPQPDMQMMQVPGADYGMPFYKGVPSKQYLPMKQPDAPLSWNPVPNTNGLMMPSGQGSDRLPMMQQQTLNPGWSVTGQPERTRMVPLEKSNTGKSIVPTVKEFKAPDGSAEYREYNPDTGKWRKVQFEDANGDGIPDAQQTAAPGAAVPAAAPRKTASGITFSRVQ